MKVVQTYWSVPGKNNLPADHFGRNCGGWPSEKLHAMSWAMSCCTFKRFYPALELYTDSDGEDWLINKLKLPYTQVVQSLTQFPYSSGLWALAKLDTYNRQQTPFMHADGDVYIWNELNKHFAGSGLFAQNIEFETVHDSYRVYEQAALKIIKEANDYPAFINHSLDQFRQKGRLESYNMGVFGGHDTAFIQYYCQTVFTFLKKNKHILFTGRDMNFIEQFFLYALAKEKNKQVSTLFKDTNGVSGTGYEYITKLHTAPLINQYVHTVATYKKHPALCEQLPMRLKYEFPKIYTHINILYKQRTGKPFIIQKNAITQKATLLISFQHTINTLCNWGITTKNTTVSRLKKTVEQIYFTDDSKKEYQLLYDIFNIEKCVYTYKKNKPSPNYIFDLLYTRSVKDILQQKFILSNKAGLITIRHFDFPPVLGIRELSLLLKKNQLKQLASTQAGIQVYNEEGYVKFLTLSGLNAALCYFENTVLSGEELITILRSINFNESLVESDMETAIAEFLLNFSLYYHFLIPVK
jgi:hypothetical protein